jgi:hypothetical protein
MFDTLVRLDRNRLPAVQIAGREVRSSVPQLHRSRPPSCRGGARDVLRRRSSGATRKPIGSGPRATRRCRPPGGSSSSIVRVGIDPAAIPAAVTERLSPPTWPCLAQRPSPCRARGAPRLAQGRYRLAVVSNFDYTPTVAAHPHRQRHPRPLRDRHRVGHGGLAEAPPRHLPARLDRDGRLGRGVPASSATGRTSTWRARRESAWRRPGSTPPGRLCRPGSRPRTSTSPLFRTSGPPWSGPKRFLTPPRRFASVLPHLPG